MPTSNLNDAWLAGWQALQGQFAKAWKDAASAAAPQAPVQEGFEMWARLAGGGDSGNEALDRMVAGARQMVQMMQGALSAAAGKAAPTGSDWASAISSALGGLGPQDNPMLDAMRQAAGEGARGFEHLFADFAAAAAPLRQDFQALMHLPAFGYARESQERQQRFALALDEYRAQFDHYNRLMADASRRALEKVEAKLAAHSEPGRQLKSFRALYDLWIDAAEEGYAEVALSSEFRHAYGALVNAQMAVRRHVQQEVERSAAALGMPTRTEIDAVHRKLAEMKRRLAELEHAGALAKVDAAAPADVAQPEAPGRRAATRSKPAKPSPASKAPRAGKAPKRTKGAASRAAPPRLRAVEGAAKQEPARGAKAPSGSFAERLAAARRGTRKPGKGGH
jgi:class III poly(R)-hydroxyalkanoic acid synthase PhaE subunit